MTNISTTEAIERDAYIRTLAEKDTYVDTAYPTSNYGGVDNLKSGFSFSGDIKESYLSFDFSDKPSSYTKAEISLEFWGVSQTMNFTVCLIEESWQEFSMTWLEKPNKGAVIDYLLVTSNDIYKIDITSLIAGRNRISVCVYIEVDNYIEDYAYITSKEGYYFVDDAPQLIWTYTETAEISVISPSASDNWRGLNEYIIQWSSQGSISEVYIDLYKGANHIEDITIFSTENDGSYNWYLSDYDSGDDYRIKITDADDNNVYGYSDYFSITEFGSAIPGYNIFVIGALLFLLVGILSIYFYRKIQF